MVWSSGGRRRSVFVAADAVVEAAVEIVLHEWAAQELVREAQVDGGGFVQPVEGDRREFHAQAAEVVFHLFPSAGADDGNHVRA